MSDDDVRISTRDWTIAALLLVAGVGVTAYLWRQKHEHKPFEGYVGPNKCKDCHEQQHRDWSATRMARSFEVLRPGVAVEAKKLANLDPDADYTHDEQCLPCHTTGYGLNGGFVSIEKTPLMAGVTCEACHGPGGGYAGTIMNRKDPQFSVEEAARRGLQYPPREEVCRACHNSRSPFVGMNYVFDYKERVQQGTHHHYPLKYDHARTRGTPAKRVGPF